MRIPRLLLLSSFTTLLAVPLTVRAQTTSPSPSAERIALAEPARPTRLDCGKLSGQILNDRGQPLVGATAMLVGSSTPYVANAEGKYLISEPVYRGQRLRIAAAGYVERTVELTTCTPPVVGLELAEGTKVRRSGKRAGQIIRTGSAYRQ